jgi:hypothetical protein
VDLALLSAWGAVTFGGLSALCFIIWGLSGQKLAALRIAGGVCLLICIAALAYMRFGV